MLIGHCFKKFCSERIQEGRGGRREEGRNEGRKKEKDEGGKEGDSPNVVVASQFSVLSPRNRNLPENVFSYWRVLV